MAKSKLGKSRAATSMMGADDLRTPEARAKHVESLVDEVVEMVKAERKAQGLPPLP